MTFVSIFFPDIEKDNKLLSTGKKNNIIEWIDDLMNFSGLEYIFCLNKCGNETN